jgi:hypothetical protein
MVPIAILLATFRKIQCFHQLGLDLDGIVLFCVISRRRQAKLA